jgi:hypothetical protein
MLKAKHRTRGWEYGDFVYEVDNDFTDDILLRANKVTDTIGGELRSVCVGHPPSELALNGGKNTGGGTQFGHLRFAVQHPWQWLPAMVKLSWLPDTQVVHTVNYLRGQPTAYLEVTCLIPANTRNLTKRLGWWNTLLTELAQCTAR